MISDVLHIMSEMSVLSRRAAPKTGRRNRTDLRLPPSRADGGSGGPGAAGPPARADAVQRVIGALGRWQAERPLDAGVLVVAVDGPGASGKSTIARAVTAAAAAALVHTDDFFLPRTGPLGGPHPVADYYDWRRLRAEALEPLLARRSASFRRFDWQLGRLGGSVEVTPSELIVLEGVFSAAPQLSDLVHRAVFVETARRERLRRLRREITPEDWDDDWLTAQHAYFDETRPPPSFDLIVPGAGQGPAG
jgi:uridine kinase